MIPDSPVSRSTSLPRYSRRTKIQCYHEDQPCVEISPTSDIVTFPYVRSTDHYESEPNRLSRWDQVRLQEKLAACRNEDQAVGNKHGLCHSLVSTLPGKSLRVNHVRWDSRVTPLKAQKDAQNWRSPREPHAGDPPGRRGV